MAPCGAIWPTFRTTGLRSIRYRVESIEVQEGEDVATMCEFIYYRKDFVLNNATLHLLSCAVTKMQANDVQNGAGPTGIFQDALLPHDGREWGIEPGRREKRRRAISKPVQWQ